MNLFTINNLLALPVFLLVFYVLKSHYRKLFLLVVSGLFICFISPLVLLWSVVLLVIVFYLAQFTPKKGVATFGVIILILNVFFANYLLSKDENVLFDFRQILFNSNQLLMTVGASFYSIQYIAYLIDVRKKRIKAESNLISFAVYGLYFPKFVMGPITRYQEFSSQLNFTKQAITFWPGLHLLLLGVFKKIVLADGLAGSVHSVFDYTDVNSGLTIFTGGLLFTFQLYFDFSGYTDAALGISKMLGINLPQNFNTPFSSASITEFWRRWHISLMRFFSDYIYFPLSYRFRKLKKHASAIGVFFTLLISGLWHGLGITFLLWSLCHIVYLVFEIYFFKNLTEVKGIKKVFRFFYVLFLVSFSNFFFRIPDTEILKIKCAQVFSFTKFWPQQLDTDFYAPLAQGWHQQEQFNFISVLILSMLYLIFERKLIKASEKNDFHFFFTFVLIIILILFGAFNSGQQFIYMQF
jgi:D-alanyl-lipoteichoic acid acyltransferase DltB (MBOAT superfamily)